MNERAARELVLAWAIESSDAGHSLLGATQRQQLSQSALAQTPTNGPDGLNGPERFLAQRATLLLHAVGAQFPAFSAYVGRSSGLAVLAAGLPLAALLAGGVLDRITDPHRVDLLSAPLLLILFWNLLVYAVLLVGAVLPVRRTAHAGPGWLARCAAGLARVPQHLPQPWPAALATFTAHWARTSAPLGRVRALRVMHACAAAFALGAIVSLYLRGLLVQYQAGWESTFLQAEQVHGLLSTVFMPVVALFGLQGFSLAEVQALQLPQSQSTGGGARWVHLYAASLLLLVVLPRCVLALVAYGQERRLSRRFRPDLGHPYVRDLLDAAGLGTAGVVLRVFPYSFTVDAERRAGLQDLARKRLGAQAQLQLYDSIAYGEELPPSGSAQNAGGTPSLDVALFNLSATPEAENHGAFLESLARRGHGQLEAWVDASGYQQRMQAQGGSTERIAQRSVLWRTVGAGLGVPVQIVHLLQPGAAPHAQAHGTGAPVVLV